MESENREKKEADDSSPHRPRKGGLKFSPKVLPKKDPKIIPKTEPHEKNKGVTIDKEIMMRVRNLQSLGALGSRAKAEKQETRVQVAFGRTDPSIPRTFSESSSSGVSALKLPEHDEPWDYTCTNCPVTLPLRRPYCGDPEESRQSSSSAQDGELTAAEELGLMELMDKPQLLFFQFPTSLPLPRQADPAAETDKDRNVDTDADINVGVDAKSKDNNRKRRHHSTHGCNLKALPGGLMGKILVYRSGKVKMTLGDALVDVSAGSNCSFAQQVVAIDTREKYCCNLGQVGKRAIVTPDIDYLLDSVEKME
ncbi:hypothetical protein ACP70R_026933 [Stipagrostis hirtigluma subsp. patula]